MKLLIICLLVSSFAMAQNKKDTKIIVTVTDTANLFPRLSLAFYEKGYSIDNKDETLGFISTKEKSIKAGFPTEVKIRALIKDSTITFTGEYKLNVSLANQPPSFDQISYWGLKNSVAKLSWLEMLSVAQQFGTAITYAK